MRILTVNNNYPPHFYGGYELTCADVMQRFREAGHEVTVLTSDIRVPGVTAPDPPGYDIRRELIAYWDWEAGGPDVPRTPVGRYRVERHNLDSLRRAVADSRPDVVSVWHPIGLSMALLTWLEEQQPPLVLTVANDWLMQAPEFDGWTRMFARPGLSRIKRVGNVSTQLPRLDHVAVNFVSDYTKRRSIELSRFPISQQASVIHPGIDETDFPLADGASDRPSQWTWSLLYVGRIDPVKGLRTLVEAFGKLEASASLEILGGGSAECAEELRRLADDLGVLGRMTFGRCPRSELRRHYEAADIVVFPSEWEEPFGLVPLEAMACGTPVAATARGGAKEFLVHEQNCLVFEAGDAEGLVAAVRRVATDQALRDELIRGGRATAGRMTIDRYAEELLVLHEEAVHQHSSGLPGRGMR